MTLFPVTLFQFGPYHFDLIPFWSFVPFPPGAEMAILVSYLNISCTCYVAKKNLSFSPNISMLFCKLKFTDPLILTILLKMRMPVI